MADKNSTITPSYGTSPHYLGKAGELYFSRQHKSSGLATVWSLHLWEAHLTARDEILDFGCGDGALLAQLPGQVKIGVEINPVAQQEATSRGLKVFSSLDQVIAQQLSFSRIISNHALEHIPNPYGVLQSLHQTLRPEGKLILVLPLDDWRSTAQRQYRADNQHNHLYAWTPQTLGNLLVEAGFCPAHISVINDCLPPVGVSFLVRLPIRLRLVIGGMCSRLLMRRQLLAIAHPTTKG